MEKDQDTQSPPLIGQNTPFIVTYSALAAFLSCRKSYDLRYLQELVPLQSGEQLGFGTVIHGCLERWHRGEGLEKTLAFVDQSFPTPHQTDWIHQQWHLARAMVKGYAKRYPRERFEVIALEKEFLIPVRNPATGRNARKVLLAGKVDGIVRMDGRIYLLEHKTASQVNGDYLDRLPLDLQIHLYALAAEKAWGIQVAGVIYNVLQKSQIKQAQGETAHEFEVRREALLAKSKTGKSAAKRQIPETDADFEARLGEKYQDPNLFLRQELLICRNQMWVLEQDLWHLCQEVIRARRLEQFLRNPDHCFRKDRRCAFVPLCQSGESPLVRENFFRRQPPHSELSVVVKHAGLPAPEAPAVF